MLVESYGDVEVNIRPSDVCEWLESKGEHLSEGEVSRALSGLSVLEQVDGDYFTVTKSKWKEFMRGYIGVRV